MNSNLINFFKKYTFYVYIGSFFFVWIVFFDGANLITQIKLWNKLNDYKSQISYFETELSKIKSAEAKLRNDPKEMERYGREKYLMKKEGETVFVIVDENGNKLEEEN